MGANWAVGMRSGNEQLRHKHEDRTRGCKSKSGRIYRVGRPPLQNLAVMASVFANKAANTLPLP